MEQVIAGDTVADVGAYVGLYTVAFAKRVGLSGRVVAFEPDHENAKGLQATVRLNRVTNVEVIRAVVGGDNRTVLLHEGGTMSRVLPNDTASRGCFSTVQQVSLDSIFVGNRLDILKVDVEGYELEVLRGGKGILGDSHLGPRIVVVEVHPFHLREYGGSGKELIDLLVSLGYFAKTLTGHELYDVTDHIHIIATRNLIS